MTNEELTAVKLVVDMVNKSDISSIRQVVTEVLRIIKDEKSSAKDLKDITAQDPPLCARLLKLANSAYYG
ncbi:MAG: HDOD domain-containing protein, partial [Candidatus Glassbacteria bacterium]